ncbi:hypothetical protein BDW02DRAFT_572610 [Decorospora gaudefroyi]|uniref:RRM domain-containing protein n=1 Tax=Decorospora gaudefroyi TaxID=184978 RepID=A0A6A5K397_9PLEO|nr:hypothetical protein BDW02DRAFT_572610 [Decorospora gaudefroyi]
MAPTTPPKQKKVKATPKTVADFTVLALTLPTLPGLPAICQDAKHYLYIKPHAPSIPTADGERSLFIANVPMDASEISIRTLFQRQLGGCMVERVEFDASVPAEPMHKRWKSEKRATTATEEEKRGKKRKRSDDAAMVAEGVVEDADSALPRLWKSEVHRSGSGAVVIFVDRRSAKGAMKEVGRAVKEGKHVIWKTSEGLGVERYKSHTHLTHPPPTLLHTTLTTYLTQFAALESLRTKLRKSSRSRPDTDGFITVSRGSSRTAPARLEDTQKKKQELDERRRKNGVQDGFYRFQMRDRRKRAEAELKTRFEEDRRRVRDMRGWRGEVRPEV